MKSGEFMELQRVKERVIALRKINESLEVVKTNIGKVRFNRNIYGFLTGGWILCGTFQFKSMIDFVGFTKPSMMVFGLNILTASCYGLSLYRNQKKLNDLRDKQHDLEHEEIKQLILTRK